jgi:archaemetzincin
VLTGDFLLAARDNLAPAMMRRARVIAGAGFVACLALGGRAQAGCTVALQPLGTVRPEVVEQARQAVTEFWGAEVQVLPAQPLPVAAWFEPRQRWRAERLLDWLAAREVLRADRVVGLTAADISTTKDEHPDWGIFGLGQLGGRACVVSTFRLGRGGVSRERALVRLAKVLNHELGHTFGLEHCPTPKCLMEDARGSIATVDAEPGALCAVCRARVHSGGLKAGKRALGEM